MPEKAIKKRKRQAIETRKRIYESALSLIAEKGLENVQIEDISKRAKVSMGLFYTYFSKKEDIITEEVFNNFDIYYTNVYNTYLVRLHGVEKLFTFIKHLSELHLSILTKQKLRYHYINILSSSTYGTWVSNNTRQVYFIIEEAVREAIKANEIDAGLEVHAVTKDILTVIRGVIYEYLHHDDKDQAFDLVEREMHMVKILIKGIHI